MLSFTQRAGIITSLREEGLVDDEQAWEVMLNFPDHVLVEMAAELEYVI